MIIMEASKLDEWITKTLGTQSLTTEIVCVLVYQTLLHKMKLQFSSMLHTKYSSGNIVFILSPVFMLFQHFTTYQYEYEWSIFVDYKLTLEFSSKVTSAVGHKCIIIQIKCTGKSNIHETRLS